MKCSVPWCHVTEGLMRRKTTSPLYRVFGQLELCQTHVPPWRVEEYEPVPEQGALPEGGGGPSAPAPPENHATGTPGPQERPQKAPRKALAEPREVAAAPGKRARKAAGDEEAPF